MNRTDPIRELDEWFDTVEPQHVPPHILDKVFAVTRRTGQRRGLMGLLAGTLRLDQSLTGRERMNRIILAAGGVAAALVVAMVGVAYLYGPTGPGAPAGPVHVSERHGYSIRLPDDSWRVVERPGTWLSSTYFTSDDPGVDLLEERGPNGQVVQDFIVYLSSQSIPNGMSFDAWAAAHDEGVERQQPCFRLQGDYENGVVGGETARSGTYHCDDFADEGPWATVQTLVAHDGRGYAIYVFPARKGPDLPVLADLRAAAKGWLSRISFTD